MTIINGAAFTNGRDVATFIEESHAGLLQDIDVLIGMGVLGFKETPCIHPQNGQTYRFFEMMKDALTLLTMGYAGAKALQFKITHLAAFNSLEAKANAPVLPH